MPRLVQSYPRCSKHKASGQAVVTLDGRDVYLGPHGTRTSKSEYDRVIAEWLANGRRSPAAASTDLTVAEVAARFWTHAQAYYVRPDGTQTGEAEMFRLAMRPLVRLYGRHPARDFGPLSLEAVRIEMVRSDMARTYVNAQVRRVRKVFRWAVAKELVPPSVLHGLAAVAGLRAGRSGVRESEPVRPVADATVEQTLPHLSLTVAAMVRLQLLTGARPGEICGVRTADVDRTGDVWAITPADHKTAHHGHARTIHVGPQAQAVLLPFLNPAEPMAPVFNPAVTEAARRAAATADRVTPLSCGNRPGTNRAGTRRRPPGSKYGVCGRQRWGRLRPGPVQRGRHAVRLVRHGRPAGDQSGRDRERRGREHRGRRQRRPVVCGEANGDFAAAHHWFGTTAGTATVAVADVAPAVTPLSPLPAAVTGAHFKVPPATFADAGVGSGQKLTAQVDWGKGSPSDAAGSVKVTPGSAGTPTTGTVSGGHAYAPAGTDTVTVTVVDAGGLSGTATEAVTVGPIPAPYEVPGTPGTQTIVSFSITNRPFSALYRNELAFYLGPAHR